MAFDAYDDYEQSERVQKWLRQNGLSIGVGIVIGLVVIFGVQQWRNHKTAHQAQAAQLYQQMQSSLAAGMDNNVSALIAQLQQDYADTTYAIFAASDNAQQLVKAKQLDKAQVSLDWAESHAADPTLKALTELRSAQLQLARDKSADALATLDRIPSGSFQGLAQELRGDVLVKLGRLDDARKAYQTAVTALGKDAPQGGALQMKIDDLAVAGKQGA